jgi:hypothetical protein
MTKEPCHGGADFGLETSIKRGVAARFFSCSEERWFVTRRMVLDSWRSFL